MSEQTIDPANRDELIALIDTLDNEQITLLTQFIRSIRRQTAPQTVYDAAHDPVIGLIDGPVDVAEHVEDMLQNDGDAHSGWTQK